MTTTTTIETIDDRIARLALIDISDSRKESLTIAHPLVDDTTFATISNALRVSQHDTIVLPRQHLETLSRGRGWARLGSGPTAKWGERCENGYRVGPGVWSVGGSDGFRRKRADTWTVEHVQVGGMTWTIAN